MQVKQINLDDDGAPEMILVQMTHAEAAYLALLTGQQSGTTSEAVMPGGRIHNSEIYDALTGDLFNRFYENGVDEAATRARAA